MHLLGPGHRRIAVITGPSDALSSRARVDGYRAALEMAGVPLDLELVRTGDFQIRAGLEQTKDLMRLQLLRSFGRELRKQQLKYRNGHATGEVIP